MNRGLDFADTFRVVAGAGTVAGVRAKSGGLVDTGLLVGLKPRATALGWRYGTPLLLDPNDARMDADQAQIVTTTTAIGLGIADGSYTSSWNSIALLPALFTQTDSTPTDVDWYVPEQGVAFKDKHWLWSAETTTNNRYAQIHAFDIEIEVALGLYLDVGWSPGEFLDFLLGLVLIDIAGDDRF